MKKGYNMNSEDYAKLAESTEKLIGEVDKEILKLSDAALESEKLEVGDHLDLMRLRRSMGEYLNDIRTELFKAKKIEDLREEYAEYISNNKEKAKTNLIRIMTSMTDEDIKDALNKTKEWEDQQNQELADRILEIKLSPL